MDISVIIPTYNRPAQLDACLAALATQTLPHDRFEVIVVDDGSATSMETVTARFRDSLQVRLLRQANAGPARARNAGAALARGTLFVFTDDDCQPEADWLSALHAQSKDCPTCLIGGRTLNALGHNVYSTASQLLVDFLYEHQISARRAHAQALPAFFTSNNLAVPATLFRQLEGFDESFMIAAGEDREFCDRWQQYDLPMALALSARVHHAHSLSLTGFWRQHLNYGRGAWQLRHARLRRGRSPLQIAPLSFYLRLIAYPLRVVSATRAARLVGLMWLSQVANTTGYIVERFRRK
jgi:GT2 family glycosyltransferase